MIYLDNGATSMPKPDSVYRAMAHAARRCANPGRGGHEPSMLAAETVFECREAAAEMFGVDDPSRVVFTKNCTEALNIAIKGLLADGGSAVISGYEHNSVLRPLHALGRFGVTHKVAFSPLFEPESAVKAFKSSISADTKCVICTHVSNVFGYVMPIREIDDLCASYGIPLVIDAAQSAGTIGIDVSSYKSLAFVCMPGHKGLLGPQGTGILLCCKDQKIPSLTEGGTGSDSLIAEQPDYLPDRFEAGTLNVPGIAGLAEGIRYIKRDGLGSAEKRERDILEMIARELAGLDGTEVFYPFDAPERISGAISFRMDDISSDELAAEYARYGICVRSGIHCSPLAHETAGTEDTGTVRVSPGRFSSVKDAELFIKTTKTIKKIK